MFLKYTTDRSDLHFSLFVNYVMNKYATSSNFLNSRNSFYSDNLIELTTIDNFFE